MATHPNLQKHRTTQEKLGRVRREYSATPAEHDELKRKLKELRDDQPPTVPAV